LWGEEVRSLAAPAINLVQAELGDVPRVLLEFSTLDFLDHVDQPLFSPRLNANLFVQRAFMPVARPGASETIGEQVAPPRGRAAAA